MLYVFIRLRKGLLELQYYSATTALQFATSSNFRVKTQNTEVHNPTVR